MGSLRSPRTRAGARQLPPTEADVELATESSRRLGPALARSAARADGGRPASPIRLLMEEEGEIKPLEIPPSALRLLQDILAEMAAGNAVAIQPIRAELTTQEAADLLNVSRPYLTGLLDRNEIPCRMVGTHRRVLRADLLNYKERDDARRSAVLDELVALNQELGLY